MPRVIANAEQRSSSLAALVDALRTARPDPRDEDGFAAFAPELQALGNNRGFLAEIICAELADDCRNQQAVGAYGPQVIALYQGDGVMVRANCWPQARHSLVRNNRPESFFYDVPHDHNFSFLTLGYAGTGYWSDHFEYDHGSVAGAAGEAVTLTPAARTRLEPGCTHLYRAHVDVHSQQPPDEFSVSLNIIEASVTTPLRDQYVFDLANGRIAGLANPAATASLLPLLARLDGAEGRDLLDRFAERHPSDRIRYAAVTALADVAGDVEARAGVFERALANGSLLVRTRAGEDLSRMAAIAANYSASAPTIASN